MYTLTAYKKCFIEFVLTPLVIKAGTVFYKNDRKSKTHLWVYCLETIYISGTSNVLCTTFLHSLLHCSLLFYKAVKKWKIALKNSMFRCFSCKIYHLWWTVWEYILYAWYKDYNLMHLLLECFRFSSLKIKLTTFALNLCFICQELNVRSSSFSTQSCEYVKTVALSFTLFFPLSLLPLPFSFSLSLLQLIWKHYFPWLLVLSWGVRTFSFLGSWTSRLFPGSSLASPSLDWLEFWLSVIGLMTWCSVGVTLKCFNNIIDW